MSASLAKQLRHPASALCEKEARERGATRQKEHGRQGQRTGQISRQVRLRAASQFLYLLLLVLHQSVQRLHILVHVGIERLEFLAPASCKSTCYNRGKDPQTKNPRTQKMQTCAHFIRSASHCVSSPVILVLLSSSPFRS